MVIRYGEPGIKYYIIISGKGSVHIPQEPKKFEFTHKQYVKFMKEYNGMVLSIDGDKDFTLPDELFNMKTFKRGTNLKNKALNKIMHGGLESLY